MTTLGMPYWLWVALGLCVLELLIIPASIYLASRVLLLPAVVTRVFLKFVILAVVLPLAILTVLVWWSAEASQIRVAGELLVALYYLVSLLLVLGVSFAGMWRYTVLVAGGSKTRAFIGSVIAAGLITFIMGVGISAAYSNVERNRYEYIKEISTETGTSQWTNVAQKYDLPELQITGIITTNFRSSLPFTPEQIGHRWNDLYNHYGLFYTGQSKDDFEKEAVAGLLEGGYEVYEVPSVPTSRKIEFAGYKPGIFVMLSIGDSVSDLFDKHTISASVYTNYAEDAFEDAKANKGYVQLAKDSE